MAICKTRTEIVMVMSVNDGYGIYKKHGSHDLIKHFRERFNRNYCLTDCIGFVLT